MKADAAAQGVLRKTWHVSPLISDVVRAALQRWQAEPVLQQLFFNRGISTEAGAMAFVQRSAPDEGDVRLLPDMAVAVERVVAAIERHCLSFGTDAAIEEQLLQNWLGLPALQCSARHITNQWAHMPRLAQHALRSRVSFQTAITTAHTHFL